MSKVVVKGESVYQCNVCSRKVRVPTNKQGLDVLQRCNITHHCRGTLTRVLTTKDINETPAFPPEIQGVQDWFQRRVLYTHEQPVQAATWLVKHNLANRPKVHVYVNRIINGEETLVEASPLTETTVDINTVLLTFATAESGLAQCVTSSSQNSTNPGATTAAVASTDIVQLSSDTGEITLATLTSAPLVGFAITYKTSGTSLDVTIEYAGINTIPAVGSPWAGSSAAIINGKKYTLRSFNITTTPLAPPYFASGAVPPGSTFTFSNYNGAPPVANDCLILLGRSPYATVDKIFDQYIDVAAVNQSTPELFYTSGKAFTYPTVIRSTYPLIMVV